MKLRPKITVTDHFAELTDPRIERSKEHKLIDIVTIAICAVICGADTWVGIETYGKAKYKWLKQFLELPNGIPSHDTFARVFARLNPQEFQSFALNLLSQENTAKIGIQNKRLQAAWDNDYLAQVLKI